ncbi:MAG: hypothetical protein IJK14_09630 [Clostridia bacterium]|nr:hypothetical protein [Clostridia bacterium]
MTLFIVVYLLALCCYFYTRTSGNKKYRAVNKYIMATMYLVFAFVTFHQRYELVSYETVLLLALFLAWMGDVFLVFDFGRGGDFFLCGNYAFITYYILTFYDRGYTLGDFWWAFVLAWVMLTGFILGCQFKPETFKLGKMRWPMTLYLCSIFSHGMCGLAAVILLTGTRFAMMGVGALLFMVSDMILTLDRYIVRGNKWIVRANSLTYFTGLLLIVLSMAK